MVCSSDFAKWDVKNTFIAVAQTLLAPIFLVSWVGNKITGKAFSSFASTSLGQFIGDRCYRIGGPSFVTGDMGYIGYALEQGNGVQLSGALATLPAHVIMALFGDNKPLILDWIQNYSPQSSLGKRLKSNMDVGARLLVQNDHYLIPAAWGLLAYNGYTLARAGFALAAEVATRHVNEDFPQVLNSMADLVKNNEWRDAFTLLVSAPSFDKVVDVLMKAPEFMQGVAILTGCLCLGVNEYLKRTNAKAVGGPCHAVTARAEAFGEFAIGMMSSCTVLTVLTGIVDHSPSLLFCSTPAFLLGNYCQDRMRQTKLRVREVV